MKTVPADLLVQLGSEPKLEVDIAWDRVTYTTYNRDTIINTPVLSVAPSSKTGTTGQVGIILDDSSGTLRGLVDVTDIHKAPAKLYLAGETTRALLFVGEVTGPVTWSESERTLAFNIESKVEDREVGFSLEESAVSCDKTAIGKSWPLCFGSVVNVPATRVNGPRTGQLLDQFGIVDPFILSTLSDLQRAAAQEMFILRFQQQVIAGIKAAIPSVERIFVIYTAAMVRKRQLFAARDAIIAAQQGNPGALDFTEILAAYEEFMTNIIGGEWKLRIWRKKYGQMVQGGGTIWTEFDNVGNFLVQQVGAFFEWFKEFADFLPTLLQFFEDTLRRTRETIENIQNITAQYYSLQDEYCRQLDLVKDEVEIECGTTFPQNEEITVYIDGLGWKGEFDKGKGEPTETFTFSTPGVPIPLYENLATRDWVVQDRECGTITDWSDVNIFYLADPTVNLVGRYCLVTSKVENYRHVVKVSSQEQFRGTASDGVVTRDEEGEELFTACTYDIIEWPKREGEYQIRRPGQRGSNAALPVYGNPYAVGGMPTPTLVVPPEQFINPMGLTPQMWNYLWANGASPTEDELTDLQAILQASQIDNIINAPILWTLPTPRSTFTVIGQDIDEILKVATIPTADWWAPLELGEVTFHVDGTITGAGLKDGDQVTFTGTLPEELDEDKWYVVREIDGDLYLANSYASANTIDLTSGTATVYLFAPVNKIELPNKLDWSVNPGETVYDTLSGIVYVANLVPSTIHSVSAFTKKKERQVLQPLHRELYTYNEAEEVDPFTVTAIKLLINPEAFGWSEQIYVSLESSVGPNVVDILEYLITTYTDFTVDEATFAAVRVVMEPLPCHFALLSRKNILEQLHEIAWLTCLQLDLINDVFYLRYLPTEPTSQGTLSDTNIIEYALSFNETVDLVTKMNITWREVYTPDDELEFIIRHNIKKYGLHEKEIDWYVYTNRDLIIRAATFWLLRQSNTWKFLQCTTPLGTLEWDVGDGVTYGDVTGVISEASYDFTESTISYTVWQPIRSGETEAYQFAWPYDLDEDTEFPTIVELEFTGSPGPGRTVATLPTGEPE